MNNFDRQIRFWASLVNESGDECYQSSKWLSKTNETEKTMTDYHGNRRIVEAHQRMNESLDYAVVYFDDGSKKKIKDVYDIGSFVTWLDTYRQYHINLTSGEGDLPEVKRVVINNKEYTPDDIEKYREEEWYDEHHSVDEAENQNHHNAEESKDIRELISKIQNSFTLNNAVMFIPVIKPNGYGGDIKGLLNPPKGRDGMGYVDLIPFNKDMKDIMIGDGSLGTPATTKEQADKLLDKYMQIGGDANEIVCTLKIVFPNKNPDVKAITYDWGSEVDY